MRMFVYRLSWGAYMGSDGGESILFDTLVIAFVMLDVFFSMVDPF